MDGALNQGPSANASVADAEESSTGKPVNLALQGGGAHGAFTWGVLDRLLEDGRIEIEAISGTSAGAMNAVVLADGMVKNGIDGAREALESFWQAVSKAAKASPIKRSPWDYLTGNWSLDYSPGYLFFDLLSRMASPYQLNPLNLNPLRDLLAETIDFERVRRCEQIKLFISATQVRTGRVKVFQHQELSVDTVMASACLPLVFQAVEIDGEAYWDGGYMGNPALFPFFYNCCTQDILIVQINPIERNDTPDTAHEILNRINEITFNASLMKEFRAIDFSNRLLDEGSLDETRHKRQLIHIIHAHDQMNNLGASSKINSEWKFLTYLRDLGRDTANSWLEDNVDAIGKQSTVDLRALFA